MMLTNGIIMGGFHSHGGTPIAGCFFFKGESHLEMDDLGVHLFQENVYTENNGIIMIQIVV